VARAAFASPVPLISGVGHETDTTIIDYVADVRAPTPSAAAEIVAPDMAELAGAAELMSERMAAAIRVRLDDAHMASDGLQLRLQQQSPAGRLRRDRQLLDDLALRQAQLRGAGAQLATLNPLATLGRGYAVVRRTEGGQIITDPAQLAAGDRLTVTVRGGSFDAQAQLKVRSPRAKRDL
jgi:exodeoxyribonuclease VII large subunit